MPNRPFSAFLTPSFPDLVSLYRAYMPFVTNGGIFVRSPGEYSIGDTLFLVVTLPDQSKVSFKGKVVWVTPAQATGAHPQGVGIQIAAPNLRERIEEMLGERLHSEEPTDTM